MIKRIGSPMPYVSRELFGGKGRNLLELGEEFPVPQGFVISSEIYHDFFVENRLKDKIKRIIDANKDFQDIETLVRDEFSRGSFKASVVNDLTRELSRLTQISKVCQAVRSSGIDEDGAVRSFAGQHDSFFDVLDPNSLLDYIKRCYASAFNAVALKYREQHGLELPNGMAVVVQDCKQFRTGFVAYSATPLSYRIVQIEAAPGHCKSVVDGRPVDSYKVHFQVHRDKSADFDTVDVKVNPAKDMMWTFSRADKSLILVPTDPKDYVTQACLAEEEAKDIAEIVISIERCHAFQFPDERKPQDVEGGIDYSDRIWVTQSRDITGMDFKAKDITLPNLSKIVGQTYNVGNGGIYDGPVVVIESVDPNGTTFGLKGKADIEALDRKYSSGYVLVTPETNPTLDFYLNNCKAIVATECGIMSHAGATARERGLIFVGCVEATDKKKLQEVLDHGDVICVAANKERGIVGYR